MVKKHCNEALKKNLIRYKQQNIITRKKNNSGNAGIFLEKKNSEKEFLLKQ